jgi:hypothetical protein
MERPMMRFQRMEKGGVTLPLVKVKRDVYFIDGRLKVEAGAVGRLASEYNGRGVIDFDVPQNVAQYVARDGGGQFIQEVDLIDVDYLSEDVPCDVVEDGGGRYERWTCRTCNKQVVRAPYMNKATWFAAKTAFLTEHGPTHDQPRRRAED